MDWVLMLGVIGVIWGVILLTWRREGGGAGGAAWVPVTASPGRSYGSGALGQRRPRAAERRTHKPLARLEAPLSRSASSLSERGAASFDGTSGGGGRDRVQAAVLPVFVDNYQPGEEVVIQYVPTNPSAPPPVMTAHQVGGNVEIRLSGTTVAILQGQDASLLIERNLLHLAREEEESLAG